MFKSRLLHAIVRLGALLAVAVVLSTAAAETPSPPRQHYLANDDVRVGVDLESGGCLFHLSQVGSDRNLLNHYDRGRFVQQSYYGNRDDSTWAGKPWRWNPVQGGGAAGQAARVLQWQADRQSLDIQTEPCHWATGVPLPDCRMRMQARLVGPVVLIDYHFTYDGPTNHARHPQELPAVFVDRDLETLVFYQGAASWTGDKLTRVEPGWPNEGHRVDECWAAYVDQRDWGVGVYTPVLRELTCYRYEGDGRRGPTGSACSYFAPIDQFAITSGFEYTYRVALTIGSLDEIRARFHRLHELDTQPSRAETAP